MPAELLLDMILSFVCAMVIVLSCFDVEYHEEGKEVLDAAIEILLVFITIVIIEVIISVTSIAFVIVLGCIGFSFIFAITKQ